jgi:hypothetical protein
MICPGATVIDRRLFKLRDPAPEPSRGGLKANSRFAEFRSFGVGAILGVPPPYGSWSKPCKTIGVVKGRRRPLSPQFICASGHHETYVGFCVHPEQPQFLKIALSAPGAKVETGFAPKGALE